MKKILIYVLLGFSTASFSAQFAYVTNSDSSSVSVINTDTNSVTATIKVGNGPDAIAINPIGTKAYVANSSSDTVSVIDIASNTVTATINVGARPRGITINPTGTKVYVANYGRYLSSSYVSIFDTPGSISIIDTASNAVISKYIGDEPNSIAISPDGTKGYVLGSYDITIFNTKTNDILDGLNVRYSQKLVFDKTGSKLYVANWNFGLSVIDSSSFDKIDIGKDWSTPEDVAINPQGTKAYVVHNKLSVVDTANNSITSNIDVGDFPMAVAVNASGTRVYVTNAGNGTSISSNNNVGNLLVIDADSNNVIATIKVGRYPDGIALTPATKPSSPITSTVEQLSCVFNWLESKYPQYYAPANTKLLTWQGNSYRYYATTDSLLVYSPSDDILWSGYGTTQGYQYVNLGLLKNWKSGTGCN